MRKLAKSAVLIGALSLLSAPAFAQTYRFDDERGNIEGKRASCEVYARIAVVQVDANRKYRCGFRGLRWAPEPLDHFRWCRYAPRSEVRQELRQRARELDDCFDRLGDFDDDAR